MTLHTGSVAPVFQTLLIANRGEIALRIAATAHRMGLGVVAVHSEGDTAHIRAADEAHFLPGGYLDGAALIAAAGASGAEAIHPGYGFLAENAAFAEACAASGLVFIGPTPQAMRALGAKDEARRRAAALGIPVLPGYDGEDADAALLARKAGEIGYPVLIKAVAGGGGRGLRRVERATDFAAALASARSEAGSAFGDRRVIVEKCLLGARHVEVQLLGDAHGNLVHLHERDCSLQRRNQKVVEEAPAPGLAPALRRAMAESALALARSLAYRGAGTAEFLVGEGAFYFLEMNTRLQVEHPVTEAVTGLDLVEWQIRVAAGEPLGFSQDDVVLRGHAVEARLYAEDPEHGFVPSSGRLHALALPEGEGVRVDTGFGEGDPIGRDYDPLIAKIVAHAPTRDAAVARLAHALGETVVAGPRTNLALLRALLADPAFAAGAVDTAFLESRLDTLLPPPRRCAAAALGLMRLLERQSGTAPAREPLSPWATANGFQLGPPRRLAFAVDVDGESEVVELAWEADGVSVQLTGLPPGSEGAETVLVDAGERVLVLIGGRQSSVGLPDFTPRPEATAAMAEGAVRSPMHGRLIAVAAPGARVPLGGVLAVVEAMKMEHVLAAPFDARVVSSPLAPGAQVAEGELVVTIAPADAAA